MVVEIVDDDVYCLETAFGRHWRWVRSSPSEEVSDAQCGSWKSCILSLDPAKKQHSKSIHVTDIDALLLTLYLCLSTGVDIWFSHSSVSSSAITAVSPI